jgi:Zn ribbon nucleic-acid-binding protein
MIVRCLGSLFVLGAQVPKKKNKKYLMRWLEENASEECVNIQYFEVIEAIENNGEKKKLEKKNNLQGPPSIINLPSYKVTPPVEVRIE